MNHGMTREQKKKLLLAEGSLLRFDCVQARRAIADEVGSIAHAGPAGMLRAVSGRSVLSLLMTALPLVLGAGRVARLLKRGMLVAGGVAAAWSAFSRWRESSADEDAAPAGEASGPRPSAASTAAPGDASPDAGR